MARRAAIIVATSAALAFATSAEAACPRLIMVSGERLAKPVVISDWDDACRLYASFFRGRPADRSHLEQRRSLRLGLFWHGPSWEPYVRDDRLGELRPRQANQVGHFYPAVGGKPALIRLPGHGEWPKVVGGVPQRILEQHGIATRIESEQGRLPWIAAGVGAAIVALLLAIAVRRTKASSTSAA